MDDGSFLSGINQQHTLVFFIGDSYNVIKPINSRNTWQKLKYLKIFTTDVI